MNHFRNSCLSVFSLALLLCACGSSGSNPSDGGADGDGGNIRTPCVDDLDCTYPETCQPDGFCEYTIGPKPSDNRVSGRFDVSMDNPDAVTSVAVIGKLGGMYVYMEDAWAETVTNDTNFYVVCYGIITNNLYQFLTFSIPRSAVAGTPLTFGVGGTASGNMELVDVDNKGNITGRRANGEVIGGQLTFSQLGLNKGDSVIGTFKVDLKPIK